MSQPIDRKTIQDLYEALNIVRKGTEDDFELRASSDEKIWGVKMWDEPSKPTFILYAGPDAEELACDAADYEIDSDEEEDDEEEEDDGENDDEEE